MASNEPDSNPFGIRKRVTFLDGAEAQVLEPRTGVSKKPGSNPVGVRRTKTYQYRLGQVAQVTSGSRTCKTRALGYM